jgi:hypothetical protein
MPRDEQRPITFSAHALERIDERGVSCGQAEQLIRAGAWEPDGVGIKGDPKWVVYGGPFGAYVGVAFVETTRVVAGKPRRVIEVLHVLTVISKDKRR